MIFCPCQSGHLAFGQRVTYWAHWSQYLLGPLVYKRKWPHDSNVASHTISCVVILFMVKSDSQIINVVDGTVFLAFRPIKSHIRSIQFESGEHVINDKTWTRCCCFCLVIICSAVLAPVFYSYLNIYLYYI